MGEGLRGVRAEEEGGREREEGGEAGGLRGVEGGGGELLRW